MMFLSAFAHLFCFYICLDPYYDGLPHVTHIWLHAWRYSGPSFSFEAPPPEWAADTYQTANLQILEDPIGDDQDDELQVALGVQEVDEDQ